MHVLFLFDRLNRFQFRADLVPSFLSINTKKDPHRRTIIMARRILRLGKKALEPSVYGKHQQLQRDTRTNVTKLRARETLDRYGMEALTPQKVNGKWRKPRVSRRKAAVMRKLAIRNSAYGEDSIGWKPSWDTRRTARVAMPPKGSIDKRIQADRVKSIDVNMEDVSKKIAKHRKAEKERKPQSFLDKLLSQA